MLLAFVHVARAEAHAWRVRQVMLAPHQHHVSQATRTLEIHVGTAALTITEWPDRCDESTTVWDAGLILAHYLAGGRGGGWASKLKGLQVIDLGAGTGIVGLTAAACGADVLLTDLGECLDILQLNAETNAATLAALGAGRVEVMPLRWGDKLAAQRCRDFAGNGRGFDVVLCGDCMYHTGDAPEQLVNTVRELLALEPSVPGAIAPVVLVSNERRLLTATVVGNTKPLHGAQEQACLDLFRKSFDVATVPLEDQHDYYHNPQVDVFVLTPPDAQAAGGDPCSQFAHESTA